ncbi:tRNA synthetases class I (M)-domain-containing protein [Xylariaceae sp. FL0804]|nr:tRNA synthetases class I (M)-domain-containing protein [Xylariaceae sp. FL0804]
MSGCFPRTSSLQQSALRRLTVRRNGRAELWCGAGAARRMRFSSCPARRQPDDKPFYITTPIFYVNAAPHVGHLYSMVLADVLKRWEVLKGRKALLSTGTDEHGIKIQRAAEQNDMTPKALCDTNAESFKDLARRANVSYDRFVRTTDADHRDAVEYFWERLRESGFVYERKHEGWYCVSDEAFYPESLVEKRLSPLTGKPFMAAVESGHAVEWTEEKNYHFRLTAFRGQLLDLYAQNKEWIRPQHRFAEVKKWVTHNLEDLSISRPVNRADWGIPVPGDPEQTIYVWLDALVNYLTAAGYPVWPPGEGHAKKGWPPDVHVVGKDILRFHCVYWPAFLMALGLPLPKQILGHGHWLMSQQKMSKSLGNVVNPFFAIDRFGVDVVRYYLMIKGLTAHDANYSNASIIGQYKKHLQSGLGGLLNRIAASRLWGTRAAVRAHFSAGEESGEQKPLGEKTIQFRGYLETAIVRYESHMEASEPYKALAELQDVVASGHKYFTSLAPWLEVHKGGAAGCLECIYHTGEALRVVGILLQPFTPDKAAQLLDRLGVRAERRGLEWARRLDADETYGLSGEPGQDKLFPQLPVED